jgi:hypothetical protein
MRCLWDVCPEDPAVLVAAVPFAARILGHGLPFGVRPPRGESGKPTPTWTMDDA